MAIDTKQLLISNPLIVAEGDLRNLDQKYAKLDKLTKTTKKHVKFNTTLAADTPNRNAARCNANTISAKFTIG